MPPTELVFARRRHGETWRAKAGALFDVSMPNAAARRDISDYAAALNISDDAALRSVGGSSLRFHALSLTADDHTIPVIHSDEGFELLLGHPAPAALGRAVTALMRPFPAGLMTEVGIVVANPVYAAPAIQAELTRSAYHGSVIWSWQQAVLAAGLQRQLQRHDLPPPFKALLHRHRRSLARHSMRHSMRNSELWTWSFADGQFHVAPFGADAADADESNAAQLWSTVYLAIRRPEARIRSMLSSGPIPILCREFAAKVDIDQNTNYIPGWFSGRTDAANHRPAKEDCSSSQHRWSKLARRASSRAN